MALTVNGESQPVEHVELSMRLESETWDGASQSWVYGRNPSLVVALEIRVDERSGQDGALAPDLYFHLPGEAPADLSGVTLDENKHEVEAYWGNDAPELQDNVLRFASPLRDGPVDVHWTANCKSKASLSFEGSVPFVGISLKVKKVTDVDGFLKKVWPALDPSKLDLVGETEIDFGEDFPEDRRHWMELHYNFK